MNRQDSGSFFFVLQVAVIRCDVLSDHGIRFQDHGMEPTHIIHGTGIFAYIYHTNQPNVGTVNSYMDPIWAITLIV